MEKILDSKVLLALIIAVIIAYISTLFLGQENPIEVGVEKAIETQTGIKIDITPQVVNESIREENVGETYQQGQQGIQSSIERRCPIEKSNTSKTKGQKVKKQPSKEKKHESKESKAYEKKEDKKESKMKKKQ